MDLELHCTIVCGDSVQIECSSMRIKKPTPQGASAQVIDLAVVREKLKCKRCDGVGLIAVMVPLKTFADSYGIDAITCPKCRGKGFCR